VAGTIIEKPVALGQVIASATGSVTGGTTLLRMADLSKVRMRALVNETDIGSVRAGQEARVTVDAYPDRPFLGAVEKIEPQAVVQQSVTMFPVIVSLDNKDGFLKPGMNGEVSLLVDRRENVLAVANDAVRTLREAAIAAGILKLNPDSVTAQVQAQQAALRGNGGGAPGGDAAATRAVAARDSASRSGASRSGASRSGASRSGASRSGASGNGASGNGASGNGASGNGASGNGASQGGRARTALVFVETAPSRYEPRVVRLGASNYDYSEVLSGLQEGEKVALLAVGALQAKRDQQNERFRSMTGGGMPGMSAPAGGAAGGGGRPGGR
jgi:HlyD family secretion protein